MLAQVLANDDTSLAPHDQGCSLSLIGGGSLCFNHFSVMFCMLLSYSPVVSHLRWQIGWWLDQTTDWMVVRSGHGLDGG